MQVAHDILASGFIGYPNGMADIVGQTTRLDDATLPMSYIKTPNVLKYVREHFACDTLNGAELEDDGGAGSQWGHWEQRIFQVSPPI